MKIDDIMPSQAPAPSAPASGGSVSIDSLFKAGPTNDQKPTQSSLAGSRAALPAGKEKEALASPAAPAATPPTTGDIARNKEDLSAGQRMKQAIKDLPKEKEEAMKVGENVNIWQVGTPVIKGVINALTNKSAGTSQLSQGTSVIGDTISKLSDSLYTLSKSAQGMKMQWMTDLKNFKPADWAQHAETIYHSFEDPAVQLSTRQQYLKDKVVQPILDKNTKMLQMLRVLGVNVADEAEHYIGRVPVGKSTLADTIRDTLPQNGNRGISTFAPEAQARKVKGMVDSAGQEFAHMVQNKANGSFEVWKGGKVVGSGKITADEIKNQTVKYMGNDYSLTNSTVKAIESNTALRYYKDPLMAAVQGNINLSEALKNAQFLEQLKHSPEFKSLVLPPSTAAASGFRETAIKQLAGYKFSERAANVLDDFAGAGKGGALEQLGRINRVAVGALFWNPLSHIANVLDHAFVQGGLVGNTVAMTYGLPKNLQNMVKAHSEVMNMGPLYRQAIKEGAGLIYPSVVLKNFTEQMAQHLGTAPEMDAVAKAWGYVSKGGFINSIYSHAAKSLWSWNDIIMMHSYMQKMESGHFGVGAGDTLQGAIKETEKHIPNYRIPDQIGNVPGVSRAAAQFLKSPAVTAFGRYDYGRLASYGNMIKDLVGRDSSIMDRAKAMDQMAMLGVGSMIIYPALDHMVQKVTGNDEATMRRFGANSVPDAIHKYSQGDKTWGMLMSSVMPIAPSLRIPVEIMSGTDTFTGKKIGTQEPVSRYLAQQVAPVGLGESVASGRKGVAEVAEAQVGINNPSQKEIVARDKAKAAEARAAKKRAEQ